MIPIYFVSEGHIYCKSVTMRQMSKDSIYATPSRTVLFSMAGMISKWILMKSNLNLNLKRQKDTSMMLIMLENSTVANTVYLIYQSIFNESRWLLKAVLPPLCITESKIQHQHSPKGRWLHCDGWLRQPVVSYGGQRRGEKHCLGEELVGVCICRTLKGVVCHFGKYD